MESQHVWMRLFYLQLMLCDAAGGSQPNSQWGGDSAGAQSPLLPATILQWLQAHSGPATHVQSAHACTHTLAT